MLLVIVIAIIFDFWSLKNEVIAAYGDSRAHITIARRVIDNLNPGVTQLGSVWLPLLHISMLPFVMNDFLYYSGLAGTIVGSVFYVLSCLYFFRLIDRSCNSKGIALIGTLLYALNINVLYMQSTPMTESITLFFIIGNLFYFVKWQEEGKVVDLIILAILACLGTLTRYELWVMTTAILIGIIITNLRFNKSFFENIRKTESEVFIFAYCGFFGIFLWLTWNWIIFHNPIYFLKDKAFSAEAYQVALIKNGLNLAYKNPLAALKYSLYSVADVSTWSLIITGFLGSLYAFIKGDKLRIVAVIGVSFSIFIFESFSIFKGNTTMWVPELYPYKIYNIRYGLFSVPFFVLFSSYLLRIRNKFIKAVVLLIIVGEIIYPFIHFSPVTLSETKILAELGNGYTGKRIPDYINFLITHYKGGLILATSAVATDIPFIAKINIRNFITEGNRVFWAESLTNPGKYATWVVLQEGNDPRNLYIKPLQTSKKLKRDFTLVYNKNSILIYRLKNNN